MSRARTMPTVLSKAVEAPSSPATASDVTPALDVAAAPDAQPTAQPATESTPPGSDAEPMPPEPTEPPMPEAPEAPAELRMDGPTPSEWLAAGYPLEAYPPQGYAAKPDAAIVEHYRVLRFCRYFRDGVVSTWPEGHVIDSLNFNIADVRAQGLPIERCTADAKNTKPSIGHWSL